MTRFIAFLRAINVGSHRVKMDHLRSLFEELGFTNVETFISSGNVIFDFVPQDIKTLEKNIEIHLHKMLGYEVATFLRTTSEIAAVSQYKPFSDSELRTAMALNVAFLSDSLEEEAKAALMKFKTEIDDFHTQDREVYWLCRKKQSDSTFSNTIFERRLKVKTTFRGINTIRKLAVKYSDC
ncbi:MAG: hypothetical protein FD167_993 [bacterium]|nr:MAG: hypothetical protein FD167_993 [bacterium]